MELRQLELFVRLAKSLNFSKAAGELYISQPTASAWISALEEHVQAQLFVRNTKEVALTKAGADFLPYALNMLAARDNAMLALSQEKRNIKGRLDIIASTIPAQHLLPEIIASFNAHWPDVMFRVAPADSRRVEREMSSFKYDFGMTGVPPARAGFISYAIYEDELVLALPPAPYKEPPSIEEGFAQYIESTPFVAREKGSGTRAQAEALLKRKGIDFNGLKIAAYLPDTHSILLAVSRGLGISIVSSIAAGMYAQSGLIRVIRMDDPLFFREIQLIHNKELCLSPVQAAFAEYARAYYSRSAK